MFYIDKKLLKILIIIHNNHSVKMKWKNKMSEFVKMTGHASGNFHAMAKSGARLAKKLKVGYE